MRWAFKWLAIYPLLLVAATGGVLYAAYQQPQLRPYLQPHWDKFAARLPWRTTPAAQIAQTADDSESAAKIDAKESDAEEPEEAEETQTDFASEIKSDAATRAPLSPPAASSDDFAAALEDFFGDADSSEQSEQSEQNGRDERGGRFAAQIARMQSDIARLQNALDKQNRAADVADLEMRLNLIDLRLRLDGDSAVAADALSSLRGAVGVDSRWLGDEIARLQNAAARGRILRTLQKLSRLVARAPAAARPANAEDAADAPAETSFGDSVAALFKRTFNVRRVADGESEAFSERRLQRMETLLLTGRRTAYLAALNELAARPPSAADANIPLLINALQTFGAPIYALNDWTIR